MLTDKSTCVVVPESNYQHSNSRIGYKTASLTITSEYSNYTGMMIYIKTQNNIPFAVDPNTRTACVDETRPNLEIKMTYRIHNNDGTNGTLELLQGLRQHSSLQGSDAEEILNQITDLYIRDASRSNKLDFNFVIYKRILLDELHRNRSIYVRETDVIISKDKVAMAAPHPNSSEGLQQFDISANKAYQGQAGVFVRVIDNENLAKARYYYSGKHLITVPSSNDPQRESGVYCTVSTTASDGLITPTTKFFTFEEAESAIGLYRTQDEAISEGTPELILRNQEAEFRAEERRMNIELTDLKHKSEREITNAKRDLELSKNENARLKEYLENLKTLRENSYDAVKKDRDDVYDTRKRYREDYQEERKDHFEERGNRRKDHYEDRSYERKDTSELIKFIPALVLGIAGTFVWMNSQKS